MMKKKKKIMSVINNNENNKMITVKKNLPCDGLVSHLERGPALFPVFPG